MWLVVTRLHDRHKSRVHALQSQGMGHGALLKVPSTRAALARLGPGVTLFPAVLAPLQPSDSLPPSATAPVPLARGLPRCGRLFWASEADDTCARQRVVRRRRVTGSPPDREWVEERRGPPRLLDRPLPTGQGRTPRRIRPLLAHFAHRALLPSSNSAPWASRQSIGFGAACSMAHTFACLRIAEAISGTGARLATGSGGLILGRAGFAPAGRQTKFPEGLVSSLPFDQHCLVALNFLYSCHKVVS